MNRDEFETKTNKILFDCSKKIMMPRDNQEIIYEIDKIKNSLKELVIVIQKLGGII